MDIAEVAFLAVAVWILFSVAFLPKLIKSIDLLLLTIIVVGAVLAYFDWSLHPQRPGWMIVAVNSIMALCAMMAGVHSEILFRREHGYWRILTKKQSKPLVS